MSAPGVSVEGKCTICYKESKLEDLDARGGLCNSCNERAHIATTFDVKPVQISVQMPVRRLVPNLVPMPYVKLPDVVGPKVSLFP